MASAQEVFLFSPTSVPGCALWLDAADASTITLSGANVTQWNDKSGNGRNMTSTGSIAYNASQRRLELDGASNSFFTGAIASSSIANPSYLIVSRQTADPGPLFTLQTNPYGYFPRYSNGIAYIQSASDFWATIGTSPFVNGTDYIHSLVYTASGVSLWRTGESALTSGRTAFTTSALDIGARRASGTERMTGFIYEFIVFSDTLTTTQRQQVEGYLAWKWGLQGSLPSTHPFKLYRPLAQLPFPTVGIPPMPIVTQTVSVFTPTQISGCQLWLDAADSSSVTLSGSSVTQWRDKSGFNNHVISGGTAPIYSSSSNAVVFNGNGYLINSAFSLPLANRSVFIVCNQTASSSSNAFEGILVFGASNVVDYNSSNAIVYNGRGSNVVANCSFGVFYNYSQNNFGDYRLDFGNVTIPAPFSIYTDVFANPSGSLHVNGSNVATDSIAGTIGTSTGFFLGARNDFGNGTFRSFLYGSIYETIVYNTAVTAFQRQQVEGYLAWKWGLIASLPNGHPYKSAPIAPFPFRSVPFNGSLSSWQPTQLSGCQLWLDAADSSTVILSGANVTQWNDKSGNGRNLATVTAGTGSITSTVYKGNRSILFNSAGVNTAYMRVVSAVNLINVTVFAVCLCRTAVNNQNGLLAVPASGFEYSSTDAFGHFIDSGTPLQDRFYANGSISPVQNAVVASGGDSFPLRISAFTCTPAGVLNSFGNGTAGQTTTGSARGSTATGFGIGFDINMPSGAPVNLICVSQFSECIVYNVVLSTNQRQQVEGYLAWKWGLQGSLPANHPFKRWPPSP